MKMLKAKLQRMSIIQKSILLMGVGLILGIISANMFRSFYYDKLVDSHNIIFNDIVRENIDYKSLFLYILGKNFREFAAFCLLSVTILGIPYIIFKIIAFGFTTGFFISVVAIQYGFKGILLILVYQFPHGIIYLPIIIVCIHRGYNLSKSIYYDTRDYMGTIHRQLKSYLILCFFLAVLLLIGSFLEAYVGAFLLKKILGLIILAINFLS
ncbi:MAG TPA: stage II sporulation protein M [Clostridiales bacterium]|nr:stage II sporulation protein M [Clostridiales bacterium]